MKESAWRLSLLAKPRCHHQVFKPSTSVAGHGACLCRRARLRTSSGTCLALRHRAKQRSVKNNATRNPYRIFPARHCPTRRQWLDKDLRRVEHVPSVFSETIALRTPRVVRFRRRHQFCRFQVRELFPCVARRVAQFCCRQPPDEV